MVAIQVLPLEPDRWPEVDEAADEQNDRLVRQGEWRTLPDRATRIRRRRLGVLLAVVVVLVAGVALVDVVVAGPNDGLPPAEGQAARTGPIVGDVYVVQPGDTLWSIAERLEPNADPRPVVAKLRELIADVEVDVGDRIPVGDL
jgi:LysM domain